MQNITQEKIENDYKKAIRDKYIIQKETDKYSYYLDNPSQALLRDLCREILKSDPRTDDLNVYRIFFKFDFNPNEENTSNTYTDKFRKIGDLYREGKKSTRINTLDLAAILVDFQPRPFKKFKEKGFIEIDKIEGPAEPGRNPYQPEIFFAKIEDKSEEDNVTEIKEVYFREDEYSINDENPIKEENSDEEESLDIEDDILEEEILYETQMPNGEGNFIIEESSKENVISLEILEQKDNSKNVKISVFERLLKRSKTTIIATTIIFGLVGTVIYFAFLKKDCMQWTGDHYEIVDCTPNTYGDVNDKIPLNKSLLDFRKIEVCDTTTCFKNDGQAIVWYSKKDNKVNFFNMNGMEQIRKQKSVEANKFSY